jgi:hypothetical protein
MTRPRQDGGESDECSANQGYYDNRFNWHRLLLQTEANDDQSESAGLTSSVVNKYVHVYGVYVVAGRSADIPSQLPAMRRVICEDTESSLTAADCKHHERHTRSNPSPSSHRIAFLRFIDRPVPLVRDEVKR